MEQIGEIHKAQIFVAVFGTTVVSDKKVMPPWQSVCEHLRRRNGHGP